MKTNCPELKGERL